MTREDAPDPPRRPRAPRQPVPHAAAGSGPQASDPRAVDRLVEENRRLAVQVESMRGDLSASQGAAAEAKARLDAVRAETERRVRAELAAELSAARAERDSLRVQLNTAVKQLGTEGKSPVVPADRVAEMLKDLLDRMQGGLEGLRVHEGEVKLRVGIEAVGDGVGFVIPSADSPPELGEHLQEVTLRFDRRTV